MVASRVKGQEDIIEDGVSGFLYPFGDISAFTDIVKRIHRGELSIDPERARARFLRFSFERVFPETYRTMTELMKK